jgi:hypothetical protein
MGVGQSAVGIFGLVDTVSAGDYDDSSNASRSVSLAYMVIGGCGPPTVLLGHGAGRIRITESARKHYQLSRDLPHHD